MSDPQPRGFMRLSTLFSLAICSLYLTACDRGDTGDEGGAEAESSTEGATGGDEAEAATVDHSDPVAVVQAMLAVAETEQWDLLGGLCDPTGDNDGDTRRICELATTPDDRGEFAEVFGGGAVGEGAEVDAEAGRASVPFTFDGGRGETMELVMRDDRWYLYSF